MTMKNDGQFEAEWAELQANRTSGSFEYLDSSIPFRKVVDDHFRSIKKGGRYGVYTIRRIQSGEVVYIGRSGKIQHGGIFTQQDIPERLKAKRGNSPSDEWFGSVYAECGPFRVEYIFLNQSPVSPALAEAKLLQIFFIASGDLPKYNDEF